MKLWRRVICILPLILFIIAVIFRMVPLVPHVVQDGTTIRLFWSNFVYDYSLDTIIGYALIASITIVAFIGITEREPNKEQLQKALARLDDLEKEEDGSKS